MLEEIIAMMYRAKRNKAWNDFDGEGLFIFPELYEMRNSLTDEINTLTNVELLESIERYLETKGGTPC